MESSWMCLPDDCVSYFHGLGAHQSSASFLGQSWSSAAGTARTTGVPIRGASGSCREAPQADTNANASALTQQGWGICSSLSLVWLLLMLSIP